MRYTYSTSQPPAKPNEAVDAMRTLLLAKAALLVQLGGANVYAHEAPADKPTSGKWVVVRERVALGGTPETTTGLQYPVVQTMVESREADQTATVARTWHAAVHALIAETLITGSLSVTTGEAKSVHRTTLPSPVAYDADDATRYSLAEYSLTMGPAPA